MALRYSNLRLRPLRIKWRPLGITGYPRDVALVIADETTMADPTAAGKLRTRVQKGLPLCQEEGAAPIPYRIVLLNDPITCPQVALQTEDRSLLSLLSQIQPDYFSGPFETLEIP